MERYAVIGVDGNVLGTNLTYSEAVEMVDENREGGVICNVYQI